MLTREAEKDLAYWARRDREVHGRVQTIVKDALRNPREGLGRPEPLRHLGRGMWSRRITLEHRLIYRHEGGRLIVHSCRNHY